MAPSTCSSRTEDVDRKYIFNIFIHILCQLQKAFSIFFECLLDFYVFLCMYIIMYIFLEFWIKSVVCTLKCKYSLLQYQIFIHLNLFFFCNWQTFILVKKRRGFFQTDFPLFFLSFLSKERSTFKSDLKNRSCLRWVGVHLLVCEWPQGQQGRRNEIFSGKFIAFLLKGNTFFTG